MRVLLVLVTLSILAAGCVGRSNDPVKPAGHPDPTAPPSPTPSPSPSPSPPSAASPSPPSAPPSPSPAPSPSPSKPRVDHASWNGSLTGAGAAPPAGPICCLWKDAGSQGQNATFTIPAGLKGIVVELVWTDATTDLDLEVLGADYVETLPPTPNGTDTATHTGHSWSATAGSPSAPDHHATIAITDADALKLAGSWSWRASAKGPADGVAFSVHVSLFRDAAPPADYTAAGPTNP